MDARELRIGFHYLHNGSVFQMDSTTLSRILMMGGEYDYDGIPLTEQILLDCGFEKKCIYPNNYLHPNGWFSYKIGDFSITDDFRWNSIGKGTGALNLHQLQNLYYALTGKELTYQPRPI